MNLKEILDETLKREENLHEGKIRNFAAAMLLSAAIASANPYLTQIDKKQWFDMNYDQRTELVKTLFSINKASDFQPDLELDRDLSNKKFHMEPVLMVTKLDVFYTTEERAKDVPVWLAMLMIEHRIDNYTADKIIYKNSIDRVFHEKHLPWQSKPVDYVPNK